MLILHISELNCDVFLRFVRFAPRDINNNNNLPENILRSRLVSPLTLLISLHLFVSSRHADV